LDELPAYAELHCVTNFTFLRGASHPEELVERAWKLGYAALAITDECSVAGVVRAHVAIKEDSSEQTSGSGGDADGAPGDERQTSLKLLIGAEFHLACGLRFVALAKNRRGYGRLCSLITRGRRAAEKGDYTLVRSDAEDCLDQCCILWLPDAKPDHDAGAWLKEHFAGNLWVAVELARDGADRARLAALARAGERLGLPLVATGNVHMHVRERRALQDALTAIRLNASIAEAGWSLHANGERCLRERGRLARLYPGELLAETLTVAERCAFSLDELRYEYPREIVPEGQTPATYLRKLTEQGAERRWPQGMPQRAREIIERELVLIAELNYEPYFLTVYDIVSYARSRGILCQGRGSAANSLVCYCLGITAVGLERGALLMERFISKERNEPPDIDVDFEHERREEVIQYVYGKYGRERAAIAATVIMYRPRSAVRDLGKVFGLDPLQIRNLTRILQWWDPSVTPEHVRQAGFDPESPILRMIRDLARELVGFPRHLSQHVGGFVISAGPLDELVPVENAAMPERTVVQWDKDDLNDLGLLKVDLLGLGMLTALRRALALANECRGTGWTLGHLPPEDPRVYEMISHADTVGVFQIESRAQMSMLPRLKPKQFYDLVIEVAIVRPGPIQGDMVHPYLRRRERKEEVDFPGPEVREVLERTLGVPIFQEQVMQLAIKAAGFTPGEADSLRRAMAAWKRHGDMHRFQEKLVRGMIERGYSHDFAQRICKQIEGFGEYGFPESHSCSFALLVYDSAWLKCYEPAAFTCALLNSQPMGFYAPAQLVRDARMHGVEVRPVSVEASDWDCTLEPPEVPAGSEMSPVQPAQPVQPVQPMQPMQPMQLALRLGLRLVKSLPEAAAKRIMAARREHCFSSVQDLAQRALLDRGDLEALAAAGALASLAGNRHLAFWEVAGAERRWALAEGVAGSAGARVNVGDGAVPAGSIDRGLEIHAQEGRPLLATPTEWQNIEGDYASLGLTLGRHPLALLRERLSRERIATAAELLALPHGRLVRTAGLVLLRQHPANANGVTFMTLEDETGQVNLIVWRQVGEAQRRPLVESRLLEVRGKVQRQGEILHVVVHRLIDRSRLLAGLALGSRDFH
jgi:error-prone DNA polymerase